MDEELVGEIARELARQDGVDDAAWFRMDGRTPDMRPWQALRGKYAERARCVLGLPGVRRAMPHPVPCGCRRYDRVCDEHRVDSA